MNIWNMIVRVFQPAEQKLDFISELPPEMSQMILRKLDPESLLSAARVSRSWMKICQSDPTLKNTARQYRDAKKLELEVMEKYVNASLDCTNSIDSRIKQLNEYYNSSDYIECSKAFAIIDRINEFSYGNHLDRVDQYSSLQFY